jgi:uncharacterized protein with FMN-binding domain
MPRRGLAALAITTVALILLLSFKTPDDTLPATATGTVAVVEPVTGTRTGTGSQPTAVPTTGTTATATPAPTTAAAGGSTASTKVDGPVVDTRYGPVQVEVVVANGKISDVVALQLPTGRRSGQISQYSAPILHDEAVQAQSANIDFVSGATYTSDAYTQSLQAAIDQAGIG